MIRIIFHVDSEFYFTFVLVWFNYCCSNYNGMMLGYASRFVGAQREAVRELFAGGEMAFRLAHWHWYFSLE